MPWGIPSTTVPETSSSSSFPWSSLIQPALGVGAQLGTSILGQRSQQAMTREQLAQQQRQFDTSQGNKQAEINRRNMLFGMAAPNLLHNIGYTPEQSQSLLGKINAPEILGGGAPSGISGSASGYPTTQPSKLASGLGMAGMGTGTALGLLGKFAPQVLSKMGLSALGGPAGLAIGGALTLGSVLANKVGEGRRTANTVTGEGGMQRDFENELKRIDSLGLPEDQAWAQKQAAYNALVGQGEDFARQGKTQAKVANQMFNTISPLFGQRNPLGAM